MVLLLAVALLTTAVPVAAPPQQTFWTLVVNDVPKGDVIAAIDGAITWLPVTALEDAGLRRFAGERRTLFNEVYVRLESLAPDITYPPRHVGCVAPDHRRAPLLRHQRRRPAARST